MNNIEIIAEIGINHNGDMDLAKMLIYEAKKAGADTVKFQLYDPRKRADINIHKYKDILLKSELKRGHIFFLKDECEKAKINFLASVFDLERLSWLEEIGINRYKIASKSIYNIDLVKAILNTNKEVIASCGMIKENIPDYILNYNKIKLLYCVSKYPAQLKDVNFYSTIFTETLYKGFSDHTIGLTASIVAMSLGAKIIEKHITLDKNMIGPDHACSIELNELKQLCKYRDEIEKIYHDKK